MDLGRVGLDGLMVGGSETGFVHSSCSSLDPETKEKWCGSGFLKQGRSSTVDDDDLRGSKMSKIGEDASRSMLLQLQRDNTPLPLFSHLDGSQQQQQMLCFSNPKSENVILGYHHPLSSYTRNNKNNAGGGVGYSMMNGGMIRGAIFTASQWMELEHQALIFKYITANVPVPSHLLLPIRKALDSAAFSHFSNSLLRPSNPLGWGGFHLGFSGSTDPEPGRCRRTDGKKWRCSRDAVVDQKYCERHMNRGRHRSRKPVEGLNNNSGHHHHHTLNTNNNAAAITTTTIATATTPIANTTNPSSKPLFSPNSGSITFGQGSVASDACATTAANSINRMYVMKNSKENNNNTLSERISALPMLPPTLDLKSKENPLMIHHHHKRRFPYEESSPSSSPSRNNINNEFGLVTSDSLLNPTNGDTAKPSQQHSLWNFIDDCPKTTPHNSDNSRTQLSISIPMVPSSSSDFISFNSPPNDEKLTLSPLRLSREFELDPIQMGLGVGSYANEESNTTRQANWIPITWERSSNNQMGGPLGEVLNLSSSNNNNNGNGSNNRQCGNESNLNLVSDGWDNSPSIGSSPTGVLQKSAAFGSLSNSSAGSSPRGVAENKGHQEGPSLCNDLLGSTIATTLGAA